MQVLCTFGIKMLIFWVYAGLVNFKSLKPAYTYTQQKIKNLIGKSHQTCIYSKKIKKSKIFRLYVGLTGIDELGFDLFEYMQVWWLFPIIFCFFEYMQVLW